MPTPSKCQPYRGPDARHDFHPESGWCIHGCGRRDDGYLINTTSAVAIVPAPEYTPEQLAALTQRSQTTQTPDLTLDMEIS